MTSLIGFTVIIPCYNAGGFILEAVESVLKQSFKYPFELIVIDDGSTDKITIENLKIIEHKPFIKVIRFKENRGAQYARNAGIKASSYNFIFTIDADDVLNCDDDLLKEGTYPDKGIDILLSNNEIAFVHCTTQMFGDFNGLTISAYPINESLILEKHHVQNSILYRREDAINAGLYNESILKWQDWSFGVGILNYRYKNNNKNNIAFIDNPYYKYRIHNLTNRISNREVSENEMVRKTFFNYPEIFRNYYKSYSDEEIINLIIENKPSKLIDLLYMGAYSLDRSLSVMKERGFIISGEKEPPNIP